MIKNALPPHIGKSIAFIYRRGETLFFALNHPGIKMEFDYKHNLIKSLLEKIKSFDNNCKDIKIVTIKSFITDTIYKPKKKSIQKRRYKERANGFFIIETDNLKLRELFQDIKEEIKSSATTHK